MKKILLTFFITISTLALYAQVHYATTNDGKRVPLKSDGTWEYVKENTSTANRVYSPRTKSKSSRSTSATATRPTPSPRKVSAARTYIRGPRGGCYYINRNGNKTYVDRRFCN